MEKKSLFKNIQDNNNEKSCANKSFKNSNISESNLIDSKIRSKSDIQTLNKKSNKITNDIINDNDDEIEDELIPQHIHIKKNSKNEIKQTKKNISESSFTHFKNVSSGQGFFPLF